MRDTKLIDESKKELGNYKLMECVYNCITQQHVSICVMGERKLL